MSDTLPIRATRIAQSAVEALEVVGMTATTTTRVEGGGVFCAIVAIAPCRTGSHPLGLELLPYISKDTNENCG